jgi:amino acid permease
MAAMPFVVTSLALMIGYCAKHISRGTGCISETDLNFEAGAGPCEVKIFDWDQVVGHIGVAIFVFEGNAVITNVRAEAKNKEKFNRIFTSAYLLMIAVFCIFAVIGYLCF